MAYCYHERLATERCAWTDANAGFRFIIYSDDRAGYDFFYWVDASICDRVKVVIPDLVKRLRTTEAEYFVELQEV